MKKLTFAIIALLGMGFGALAQSDNQTITVTVPDVALLAINAKANFTAAFVAPTVAGNPITAPASNSAFNLVYSSIKKVGDTRKISVVASQTVAGVDVTVAAATPTGTGTVGAGSSKTLTATSQPLITAIGSCYTGITGASGSALTYTFALATTGTTYADLVANTTGTAMVVTYTLAD